MITLVLNIEFQIPCVGSVCWSHVLFLVLVPCVNSSIGYVCWFGVCIPCAACVCLVPVLVSCISCVCSFLVSVLFWFRDGVVVLLCGFRVLVSFVGFVC